MKLIRILLLAGLTLIFAFSSLAYADVPQMINYQGKITTPTGALVDTTIGMTFTIYDDSTGGNVLWTETQPSIAVEKGIFSVLLGSVNSIPDSVFDGNVRYLGVNVGADPEMTPRKQIVSVGYAYKSEYSDTAEYAQVAVSDGDWKPDTSGINIYRLTGNVGIGTAYPAEKLDVAGNIHASGTISSGSSITIDGVNDRITASSGTLDFDNENLVTTGKATIGPGHTNTGTNAFVAGQNNVASGQFAVVSGGGGATDADSNSAIGDFSAIGGGKRNTASDTSATVAGGYKNTASRDFAAVGGGNNNTASGYDAIVGGGEFNTASGKCATIGGGRTNRATSEWTAVAGGSNNYASGWAATVGGGDNNTASSWCATVAGGRFCSVTGFYATIPGGIEDSVAGDFSFAAGKLVRLTSSADYTFGFGYNFRTSTPHAAIFYDATSEMKVGIQTTSPTNILTVKQNSATDPIADAWTTYSSREYKTDIHELTPEEYREALKKVISVPMVRFHYRGEDTKEKIGLIAEDAPAEILAEGDNKAISLNEYISLLHAALKAQQEELEALRTKIEKLESSR